MDGMHAMKPPTKVTVYHNGEFIDLALWWPASCVDCRYNNHGQCKLFGVMAGMRPAVCLSAEGEATARRNKALKELAARGQQ